jgi:NADH-quinone oxidoreductase subunit L
MRYLALIPLLPALGALLNGVAGIRYFSRQVAGLLACATVGLSFAISLVAFAGLLALPAEAREQTVVLAAWIPPMALQTAGGIGTFSIDWALRLDPLSSMMSLVVSGIGFLIHVYSTAYMHGESRGSYARFFCYLNLFVFFMLTLVLAANYLVMFVGWEGVGLCSYLLIGYWYEKKSASDAGKKAFLVNRVGDFGFMLGMFLIFYTFGTLDFRAVQDAAGAMPVETATFGVLSLACLLLFVGATGKSAQIPLYVWLPDAMEGPTPVSALIHAATMVTAGVYMVCRNAVLFSHAPMVMEIVAVVGVLTALVAASIGLVQNDIKRVLAYSTVSQLGYMFLATGVGAFAAGAFHLMTHAFFKALLFLGSGSVIHGIGGEQDMRRMGDLRKYLPVTFATMMVGTLAIAGIPPLSGFFSKDEILWRTFEHNTVLWGLAAVTALMTAFYMFRLMAMTFYGAYRGPAWAPASTHAGQHGARAAGQAGPHDAGAHGPDPGRAGAGPGRGTHGASDDAHGGGHGAWHGPHESPKAMTVPLMLLAAGAAVAGFIGLPAFLGGSAFERFLEPSLTPSVRHEVALLPSGRAPEHVTDAAATPASEQTAIGPGVEAAAAAAAAHAAPSGAHAAPAGEHGPAEGHADGHDVGLEIGLMLFSVLVAVAGIAVARHLYITRPERSDELAQRFATPHRVLLNKYYVDEFYDATAVRGVMSSARGSWLFDRLVVDGAVNGSGWSTRFFAWLSGVLDKYIVDGLVNLIGGTMREASHGFRRMQTGLIQNYALLMLVGVFAFVSVYLILR